MKKDNEMKRDTFTQAVETFKTFYNTKRRPFTEFDAMPDPQVEFVWLVVGKFETKKEMKMLAAIVYINKDDVEEVSVSEVLKKYPYSLDRALIWASETTKKVVDVAYHETVEFNEDPFER
jgi:hypothetical protein